MKTKVVNPKNLNDFTPFQIENTKLITGGNGGDTPPTDNVVTEDIVEI